MTGLQKLSLSRIPSEAIGWSTASKKATLQSPTRTRAKNRIGPKALPRPFVLQPRDVGNHRATIIMLHGFTSSGKQLASAMLPALTRTLGPQTLATLKLVFLNAPVRTVSCYGDEAPRHPAWHDYFTDHGGDEGHPEIEEEIDEVQLAWSRQKVHEVIDQEAAVLGGDYARVAIGGRSQGCCTALDAALTHPMLLAGVFASFGHVYSATTAHEYPEGRHALRIRAFHGAGDQCIAASLALRTYADLADLGFDDMSVHVEPKLTHCEPSEVCNQAESVAFAGALKAWGLLAGTEVHGGQDGQCGRAKGRRLRSGRSEAGHQQRRLRSSQPSVAIVRGVEPAEAMHMEAEVA